MQLNPNSNLYLILGGALGPLGRDPSHDGVLQVCLVVLIPEPHANGANDALPSPPWRRYVSFEERAQIQIKQAQKARRLKQIQDEKDALDKEAAIRREKMKAPFYV